MDALKRLILDVKRELSEPTDRAIARRLGVNPSLIVRAFQGEQQRLQQKTMQRITSRLHIHNDYFERNPDGLSYHEFLLPTPVPPPYLEGTSAASSPMTLRSPTESYSRGDERANVVAASRILGELLYRLQDAEIEDPGHDELMHELRRAYLLLR
ncbi:MAG: hypothetical protein ACPGUV_08485 [Polyangiales bacterium]